MTTGKYFGIIAALLITLAILWIPALFVPFWADDFAFLQNAQASASAGSPWWAAFWPESPRTFWRPLSQEIYWRWIQGGLGGDPMTAHISNLVLFIISGASVGIWGMALARSMDWSTPARLGCLSALVYLVLSLHFLPVHWVSAANNSFLMIGSALALAAWTIVPVTARTSRPKALALLVSLPLLQCLALLSKESAILLPALMLCLSLFTGFQRYRRAEAMAWLACLLVIMIWLILRSRFTAEAAPAYDWQFGANLVRNAFSLGAWLLNVPRESLRLLMEGQPLLGSLWMAATAIPILIAIGLIAKPIDIAGMSRGVCLVLLFIILAYAPYFPLAWNSYAYYAAVAISFPAILFAQGLLNTSRPLVAVLLLCVSSIIAVQGSRAVEYPGLIARAQWAEKVLEGLSGERIAGSLSVRVASEHRFFAIGLAGLARELKLDANQIILVDACSIAQNQCLVIDSDGEWHLEPGGELPGAEAGVNTGMNAGGE